MTTNNNWNEHIRDKAICTEPNGKKEKRRTEGRSVEDGVAWPGKWCPFPSAENATIRGKEGVVSGTRARAAENKSKSTMPWNLLPPINGKSPGKREVYITEKFDSTTSTWPRPASILSRQICLRGRAQRSAARRLIISFYITGARVYRPVTEAILPDPGCFLHGRFRAPTTGDPSTFASSNRLQEFSRWTVSNHLRSTSPVPGMQVQERFCGTLSKYFIPWGNIGATFLRLRGTSRWGILTRSSLDRFNHFRISILHSLSVF